MQVVEQQQDRSPGCGLRKLMKVASRIVECAVADLARIVDDARHGGVRRKVEAEQVPQHRGIVLVAQLRGEAGQPCSWVHAAVETAQHGQEQLAQQAIGLATPCLGSACLHTPHGLRLMLDPIAEFDQQSRLAQSGIAKDRDGGRAVPPWQFLECHLQALQLCVAPDHADLQRIDATPATLRLTRAGPLHKVAAQRRVDTLDPNRRLFDDIECATDLAVGVMADAQRAGRCVLFHPRRDVHCRPADRRVCVDTSSQQHLAGMDAGAHVEFRNAVLLKDAVRVNLRLRQDGQAGTDGAFRVVLVGLLCAEGRQQRVASVLQHPA